MVGSLCVCGDELIRLCGGRVGEVDELEGVFACGDDGGNALDGDGVDVCDEDFAEVCCRVRELEEVVVVDGHDVGVAKELEAAEVAEGEGGVGEDVVVEEGGGMVCDFGFKADSEELEGGEAGEGGELVPVGGGAVAEGGPGDGDGADVGAVLEDAEDVVYGVVAVDAVEPNAADVASDRGVVVKEAGRGADVFVRVLVDDGEDLSRGGGA